jgi:hypothetical protein
MLRTSAIEAAKMIIAANFILGLDVRLEGFDDVGEMSMSHGVNVRGSGEMSEYEQEYNQLDIWAHLSIDFQGELPDSYRVLNSIVLDWVEEHQEELAKIIDPKLIPFLQDKFEDLDVSDLTESFGEFIWEDQTDYNVGIDEDDGRLHFCVELVLDIEEDEPEHNDTIEEGI